MTKKQKENRGLLIITNVLVGLFFTVPFATIVSAIVALALTAMLVVVFAGLILFGAFTVGAMPFLGLLYVVRNSHKSDDERQSFAEFLKGYGIDISYKDRNNHSISFFERKTERND